MAKLNPIGERIVARAVETEAKTASGLYLPDGAKEKSKIAEVVAVGGDVKSVKTGDKIVYREYSTTEVKLDGTEYIIIKEEDVLATVK
ncbi:MAG: co-chaperone GroES [Candidatus Nomurabacteria bacterium]|jgi:chaperonin GroES|nr:co-chaperone GroES [Candidatus Nomurabacteria bacterium]